MRIKWFTNVVHLSGAGLLGNMDRDEDRDSFASFMPKTITIFLLRKNEDGLAAAPRMNFSQMMLGDFLDIDAEERVQMFGATAAIIRVHNVASFIRVFPSLRAGWGAKYFGTSVILRVTALVIAPLSLTFEAIFVRCGGFRTKINNQPKDNTNSSVVTEVQTVA